MLRLLVEILDTILEMGANTILLQGIQASDGSGSGLPLHYFAINHRLASNGEPETARQELKSLVQACHTRGIEVMIEVFNMEQNARATWEVLDYLII